MIVHKFGGTSVGSPDRFRQVAAIIAAQPAGETPPVVVVSAMSGVTNALIAGARAAAAGQDRPYREIKAGLLARHLEVVETALESRREQLELGGQVEDRLHELERLYRSIAVLGEVTRRGYDAVSAAGEQLAAALLAAVLREHGQRAEACSATELIVTDAGFGAARPDLETTRVQVLDHLHPLLEGGIMPVVTGYLGATPQGVTTTLGRSGSDYSAAILGACLAAEAVWIWSDVDGILTADPHLVPEARTLPDLSYAEAAELAYYGAEVLHPKTLGPLRTARIPLRLVNSFNPGHPGTWITAHPSPERDRLPAIISSTGLALIALGSDDDRWTPDYAARALSGLARAGLEVPMFSQSFAEHSLNLVVRRQDQEHCLQVLYRTFNGELRTDNSRPDLYPGNLWLGVRDQVATVSIVGVPGWNGNGVMANAFAALGRWSGRVIAIAQAASEHSVSFCIPEAELEATVQHLHQDLGLA